ncbi:unnamed protein product [Anisakis simplex]|uniref:NTR domain-containing protein n=1 Tax=Anisakis simplex TaxID=6269 RepID=A0A0M3JCG9_ANISI|nr:unnamed protein product [Anisakis simplex]
MGNCLVVSSMRSPGKEVARCIRQELSPRKLVVWSFLVDSILISILISDRLVSTTDQFDKCTVGCGPDGEESFCGQIAAIYVFGESITLQQANSLYCLGAIYQSNFKHDAESDLPEGYKKVCIFSSDHLLYLF